MAEETQGIQNKWLLLIAVVLGAIVVFLYNAHIKAIQEQQKAKMVKVIVAKRDLGLGDRIQPKDIESEEIPIENAEAFGKVMKWDEQLEYLTARGGKAVNQPIRKGQLIQWDHIYGSGGLREADKIREGYVAIPIEFDTSESPGAILAVNDTVNLQGIFPNVKSGKGEYRSYRFISGVRVLGIGGMGEDEMGRGGALSANTRKNYRKLLIELDKDTSVALTNLLTHMYGGIKVEVNQAGETLSDAGKINPELKPLTEKAQVNLRGQMMPR